jgi:hypothetical protein
MILKQLCSPYSKIEVRLKFESGFRVPGLGSLKNSESRSEVAPLAAGAVTGAVVCLPPRSVFIFVAMYAA